jgi:hypothetical protein
LTRYSLLSWEKHQFFGVKSKKFAIFLEYGIISLCFRRNYVREKISF